MTRLIGVVHLAGLPGSPRAIAFEDCVERAVADARALELGGADAIVIENFHDVPFRPGAVEAHTVAAMTAATLAVRAAVSCELGVNVLRNDATAALGIALACGASFIRVNVHTGAMLTDQGIITGRADETLRLRRLLDAERIRIFADVFVKHAVPIGPVTLEDAVRDTVERGLADAVIVTGNTTGSAASPDDVVRVVEAAGVPVYVGSGVTADNLAQFVPPATGVIVGSWLKRNGMIANAVDAQRVEHVRSVLNARTPGPAGH
ncbi:MAG: BtpA/SgcQ family protein [Thermomicrobiales bacterium]